MSEKTFACGCIFLVARCNIIRASWETKKKRFELQKKVLRRIFERVITLSAACPPYVFFCCFVLSTLVLCRKKLCFRRARGRGVWQPLWTRFPKTLVWDKEVEERSKLFFQLIANHDFKKIKCKESENIHFHFKKGNWRKYLEICFGIK